MFTEVNKSGTGNTITFTTNDEVRAAHIGFLMLEHYTDEAIMEVSAYLGLMRLENKVRSDDGLLSMDTTRIHERSLLAGLLWVAYERDRLLVDAATEDAATKDIETTISKLETTRLSEMLDILSGIAPELAQIPEIQENYIYCWILGSE